MSALTPIDNVEDTKLAGALGERYLAYALSTIMHRALPDVRDGLKPVHRRILFAMRQLKLAPGTGFKKSARVVGDVIGRYHPHGDQSVYDALVRLAQDFSSRYPLIEGQGNFGNIDGDNAAAMRYTEARMTAVAELLLQGIDEDAVDFRSTYDETEQEPMVLPGAFPNLLANGSSGIAVGMATNIPPHNVSEICDALLHLIKTPNARVEKLVSFIKGPDLPTGGIIIEPQENIIEAYRTGRGGFRVRAKWEREKGERGSYNIVITEIPYQVQKSKLIERIAELIQTRRVQLLTDVRDESAEDIRIVLEPKSRTVDAEILMESLFKLTDLESRVSLNMNVLDADQTPRVMTLAEVLLAFLDHRRDVLLRRSKFRIEKIERRLEILSGYLIAYLNLDEVIRIIREEDEPKRDLIATFDLTDVQAEAILNMRLRSLRKLEELEIRKEDKELKKERKELKTLVKSKDLQDKSISHDLKALKKEFGLSTELGKRRSVFAEAPDIDIDPLAALVEQEPITVICSEKGWIRALRGHTGSDVEVKYKEGDRERFRFHAETTDKLIVFATNGKFYTLGCDRLPGGRGNGEPIRLSIDLENDQDLVDMFVHRPERTLIVAATSGHGFLVPEDDVLATKRGGKQVLNVKTPAEAKACSFADDGDTIAVIGENRKLLLFPIDQLPTMSRGRGVVLQKYKDGGLADVKVFTLKDGLSVPESEKRTRTFTKQEMKDWRGQRANAGRLPPRGFPRNNRLN